MKVTDTGSQANSDEGGHLDFFDESVTVEELAARQGVSPVTNLDDLLADFWPESDSLEDFAATVWQWRCEGG